jgi:pregnancy-associated plasma protein-A
VRLQIPVEFICVHDGPEGRLEESVFEAQFEALHNAYSPLVNGGVEVSFTRSSADVKYVDHSFLFRALQNHQSPLIERWAKQATELAGLSANPSVLRFFTVHTDNSLLGWANIPLGVLEVGHEVGSFADAAFMSHRTLPGAPNSLPDFDLGVTGVHEVGHWLGLWHTFQGGCSGSDQVHDTVRHDGPNYGRPDPELRNGACDPRERAPVKNYMNYTDDAWMDHFTAGQLERIKDIAEWLRPDLVHTESLSRSSGCNAGLYCGTPVLTVEHMHASHTFRKGARERRLACLQQARASERSSAPTDDVTYLQVPVHFVCIHDGEEGLLDEQAFRNQFTKMNEVFRDVNDPSIKLRFEWRGFAAVEHPAAFRGLQKLESPNVETLAQDVSTAAGLTNDPSVLRFFTIHTDNALLGWGNIPLGVPGVSHEPGSWADACFMSYRTLPGTKFSQKPFHLGITGVHEVCHWLGLWHTFEGGCSATGDEVHDTVAHQYPNFGTPNPELSNGACNAGEKAPVKNFMNYTDDEWMNELTNGQIERIKDMMHVIRPGLDVGHPATRMASAPQ